MSKFSFLYSVLLICLLFPVFFARSDVTFRPCVSSPNVIDSSIAHWRRSRLDGTSTELEYHVCGKTFTIYSFVTHGRLNIESNGVSVYSFESKIREPSNDDIDPNTYCFQGVMNINIPYMEWPTSFVMSVSFFEANKEPSLNLCSQ